jgi:asparagine synthase (glutamine-hydrolysing)
MCGIAGIYRRSSLRPVTEGDVRSMCDVIAHRGPDDDGIYFTGPVGLGHRRLSIIDVVSGHQPISNEDGSVWIVFNGEIYNHHELRELLVAKNHVFKTRTDTEVIVHLYEEYGVDCVTKLRGMFAFAIWDARMECLVLARDRFGEKPLYYALDSNADLLFGSEIKSLLACDGLEREIEYRALDQYLHLLYVPSPLTMFRGIYKLPAAHILTCSASGVNVREYWDLTYPEETRIKKPEECLEEFRHILRESVGIRLESEVPLGAFLSGGIDSSAIVALMTETSGRSVICASVGFEDEATNELPYAREVAEHLHTIYHEHYVSPKLNGLLSTLTWHFDEPFGDSSSIPTYWVSEIARRHVTVALSGDGGDEVLGGYMRHVESVSAQRIHCLPSSVRNALSGVVKTAWPSTMKGKRFILNALSSAEDAAISRHYDYILTPQLREALYSKDLLKHLEGIDGRETFRSHYRKCSANNDLDKALYLDLKTYLADDILIKVDRMSMAHGLEVRAPFLDHKLVEFVATLPPSLKVSKKIRKVILRAAMKDALPQRVFKRPKQGFSPPLKRWIGHDLRDVVEDLLLDSVATGRGYFKAATVRQAWSTFLAGGRISQHLFFALVMLEIWHREMLDSSPSAIQSPRKIAVKSA